MPRSYGTTNAAPYAAAPAVGAAGDTYFNTTSKAMFMSDGASWIQIGGVAPSQAYWMSRCPSGGTINTASLGTVPVSNTPTMAAGFSYSSGNVVCNVAGKYMATFLLMANNATASTNAVWAGIQQFRGATNIVNWDNIESQVPVYTQVICTGEFDMAVGDTLVCVAQAAIAGTTIGGQTSFAISPMGGPTGATGPSGGPVPTGGVLNQVIVKQSATDFAVAWQDQPGVVAYKFGNVTAQVIGSSITGIITLTAVPLTAGRLYKTTFFSRAINNGTSNLRYQFVTAPAGWNFDAYSVGSGTYQSVNMPTLGTVAATGTYTIQVGATSTPAGAQVWSDIGSFLLVEDIGANRGQQ
jgi:hypothetical protein